MPDEFIDDIIADIPADADVSTILPDLSGTPSESTEASPDGDAAAVPGESSLPTDPSQTSAPPEVTSDTTGDTAADGTSVEALAEQLGWNPSHTGESYVDAATYILKSKNIQDSMRDHNRELKTQLVDMKDSIAALQSHNEHVYKAEVTRLQTELTALNAQKKDAIELGDVEKVNSLDEQIDSVKQTISTPEPKPVRSANPAYDDWVKDNQWYTTEPEMASYADQVAQQYAGAPADRIYKAVRSKVAELWPEKFEVTPTPTTPLQQAGQSTTPAPVPPETVKPIGPPSPVEGGVTTPATQTFTKADLTEGQRSMMQQFSRLGIMSEDQYISDIAKL